MCSQSQRVKQNEQNVCVAEHLFDEAAAKKVANQNACESLKLRRVMISIETLRAASHNAEMQRAQKMTPQNNNTEYFHRT